MYTNHRPKHFKSHHPHIEQAAKTHRRLLNVFGVLAIFVIFFSIMAAALLLGQL
jgi:uncharacterized membrane protein